MDLNEQVEWEREKAHQLAANIAAFAKSGVHADDDTLINQLREHGNTELADKIAYYLRESANIAHRTYHITEDEEDSGIEQATRRANYLAWQASKIGSQLAKARKGGREYLASSLRRKGAQQAAVVALNVPYFL